MDRNGGDPITFVRAIFLVILTAIFTLSGWSLWKINELDEEIHNSSALLVILENEVVELHKDVRNLEIYTYPSQKIPPQ